MSKLNWEKQNRKEAAYRSRGQSNVPQFPPHSDEKPRVGPAKSLPDVEWFPDRPAVVVLSEKEPRKKKNRRNRSRRWKFEGEAFSRGVAGGRIRERQLIIDTLKANGFAAAAKNVERMKPIKPPKW